MTKKNTPAPAPEAAASPPPVLTTEQIQEFVDESINSLELDDLKTLDANLKIALAQLDNTIDTQDEAITACQAENKEHAELTAQQEPLLELKESVEAQIEAIRGRIEDDLWIVIDGEIIDVSNVTDAHETAPAMIEEGRRDWYVDESAEEAGKRARAYWADMAENDPEEFTCMVGEATLCKWALNQYAGPGSTHTRNLEEWLDLHLDVPEEQYASYDGSERAVDFCSEALISELGFTPTVAYRHN